MSAVCAAVRKKPISAMLWGLSAIIFLFLAVKNSALSASLTLSALSLCGKTLVPALFPSAVASRVLAESGALSHISKCFDAPAKKIFGLDGEALAVAVTGVICGFPTGAVGGMRLYERGRIDDRQLLLMLTLSGTPSLSFLVFAVGERGFGDRGFGFFLFFATLLSSAAVTALLALLQRLNDKRGKSGNADKKGKNEQFATKNNPSCASIGVSTLTNAVSSSALDIVRVCAFVIFFSVAAGLTEHTVAALSLSNAALLPLGCLEITGGMTRAAVLGSDGRLAAAFFSGFGGLCAAAQVGAIVDETGVSLGKYILLRFLSGILCAVLSYFL